jgi:hypothetical protein
MTERLGLSVGATNLAAVVVDRAAVTRSPVLTLYPHRPPEVGVPSENPHLGEPGLILTDFVDRTGDPVGILAADGSSHRGEVLLADALRALLYALTRGRTPDGPVGVTHPAHWGPAAVDALRASLAEHPEFRSAAVVSDATAALAALAADPGLPGGGVVALCDLGGSGTTVTLAAGDGLAPVGPGVRHADFSGALVDQALLTHVLADLSAAGAVDVTGTSAIGSLTRLRAACRAAKERLSTETVTALTVELPGHRSEVRLTRTELDEAIRAPVGALVGVVRDAMRRNGFQDADLVAVATSGGGARIPLVTTTLSENFRVPVVTTPQPELAAAVGAGLTAAMSGVDAQDATALAPAAPVAAAAGGDMAAAAAGDMAASSAFGALAWSDAEDVPDVAPVGDYDYAVDYADAEADPGDGARPGLQFGERELTDHDAHAGAAWYRRPAVALGAGAVAVLIALVVAIFFVRGYDSEPAETTAPSAVTTTTEAPAPAPAPEQTEAPVTQAPEPETVTQTEPPPVTITETAPPVTTEAPVTTTEAPVTTTEAPVTTTEPPVTTTEAPSTTTRPRLIPTLHYSTIPGLPFVPAPPGVG